MALCECFLPLFVGKATRSRHCPSPLPAPDLLTGIPREAVTQKHQEGCERDRWHLVWAKPTQVYFAWWKKHICVWDARLDIQAAPREAETDIAVIVMPKNGANQQHWDGGGRLTKKHHKGKKGEICLEVRSRKRIVWQMLPSVTKIAFWTHIILMYLFQKEIITRRKKYVIHAKYTGIRVTKWNPN